jgi:hypothetical protein
MLRIKAVFACILLALPLLPMISARAAGTVELPIGSLWLYEYSERLDATVSRTGGPVDAHLTISGTRRVECTGLSDSVVGSSPQTLQFHTSIRANISGQVVVWYRFPGGSSSQSRSAEGTLRITSDDFYNLTTGFLERSVYDQELDVRSAIGIGFPTESMIYYSEHNETKYTKLELNSFGKNIDPGYGNLVPGDDWTIVYQGQCNTTGVIQTSPFSFSGGVNETLHYTYIGELSITVPAGVFECKVLQSAGDGYNTTEWYDPAVEDNVKVVSSAENDTVTSSLMSYTLNHKLQSVDESPPFNLTFFIMAAVVAVSATILIPLVYLWATRRSPQK